LRIASSCSGEGAGARHAWRRRRRRGDRQLDQVLAVETDRGRAAFLRRNLVLPNVPVRQLERDFKLDRHQVVAPDLLGTPGRDNTFDCRKPFFPTECFARLRQNRRRILPRSLRWRSRHLRLPNGRKEPDQDELSENAHRSSASQRWPCRSVI
jgi:hypothetical protein